MALSISQLLTPMSAAQFRSSAVFILQGLGLQPQLWAQGGIASSILTVSCNLLASASTELSNAIAQNWNPTASGAGLQLLSKYFYGVTPPQPTFASGFLTLTNIGGGIYSYPAGQASFASTVRNQQGNYPVYTNAADFTLLAGSRTSPTVLQNVPITCTVQGTQGNAPPGFVSNLITNMQGVSCTNPASIAGLDGLSDAQLKQLNINSIGVHSVFGPRTAYAYAIQTAVNAVTGNPVNVNRWTISIASHTGDVTIYVASPAGPVSTPDLEGISNNIEKLARPDAVTVLPGLPGYPSAPASATTINYGPSIQVYMLGPIGTTPDGLQLIIETALTAWFEGPNNPIGGLTASDDAHANFDGIFESGVTGVIAQAIGTQPGCSMLSTKFIGTSDLPLAAGQVAANATTVSVNIRFTS